MKTELKSRILLVLKYLYENTDDSHSVSIVDILLYLESEGISANRHTIPHDVEQLQAFGFDVICTRSTQNRYSIGQRLLELAELKLLVDAVQSSRFITTKKSRELISKLGRLTSVHQAKTLKRSLYVEKRVKSANESIFYCIDLLNAAIASKCKIEFQYIEYTPDRKRCLKHDGQVYSLSPYALVWNDDSYYVVGYSDSHEMVVKFRVDRMSNPRLTKTPSVKKPKGFDIAHYTRRLFSMYDGELKSVELLCDNNVMKYIIDRFGAKVKTSRVNEERFTVTVEAAISPTFLGWVFSFGGKIRILSPADVREQYISMAHEALSDMP